MASQVTLLQLSPTMTEGTIVKWLVKEGDEVSSGMPIAEVETDKAVMEQEAFEDGKVLKVLVSEGDQVEVGSLLMVTGEEGEDISSILDGADGKKAPKKEEEPKKAAKKSDKAKKPAKDSGDESAEMEPDEATAQRRPVEEPGGSTGGRIIASPLAKKMAKEGNLDLSNVKGSGPGGRIVKQDVEAALSAGAPSATPSAAGSATPAPQEGGEEIKLSGMRQTIARRLVESKQQVPHFQLTVEVRGEKLLDAVNRVRAANPDDKVTVTHFIIKAMAANLMRHKALRSQWAGDKLIVHPAAHISVAVAIDEGLVTPVIRNAQSKGVLALASELRELAGKARDRKLTAEDMSGGTQTISNLGMYGIHEFNAIINPPEASILAVSAMEDRPVVENGQLTAGKVMKITMSCDHRVVDGSVGAQFLSDLKAALEDPLMILA